jgi:hypothetical protein
MQALINVVILTKTFLLKLLRISRVVRSNPSAFWVEISSYFFG